MCPAMLMYLDGIYFEGNAASAAVWILSRLTVRTCKDAERCQVSQEQEEQEEEEED
jgi:hypothetical protein